MGRFLSATNLDEIPQLWNVLVGEMSLVGPRPSPFRENQVCVPWREGRLSVRPGVTGLWQICRHDRDKGDFHQWIYFDLLYVRNLSLWLDIKILALTPLSFLRSGYVPLSWVLRPEQYGERRTMRRERSAVAVSADGRRGISGSGDQTLKLWDINSGEVVTTFFGEGGIICVQFTPQMKTMVAGDASGAVHFLRLENAD